MHLDDIEQFPKNAEQARYLLKEAFEISSRPSMDGLPEKYKKNGMALNKLRRIMDAMHLFAAHKFYQKSFGKPHSEFSLRDNKVIVVFDTVHLQGRPYTERFEATLEELFDE